MLDTQCTICKEPAVKQRAMCYEYMIGNKMGPYIISYCDKHYEEIYKDKLDNEWNFEWTEERARAEAELHNSLLRSLDDTDFGQLRIYKE